METKDGEFRAPYHTSFVYEIGEVYRMKGLKVICNHVNQGFHGYIAVEDALKECKRMNGGIGLLTHYDWTYVKLKQFVVVECRIPFFSRFIEGKDESGGKKAVVSDRIKIVSAIS
jgi:hypothetical protein